MIFIHIIQLKLYLNNIKNNFIIKKYYIFRNLFLNLCAKHYSFSGCHFCQSKYYHFSYVFNLHFYSHPSSKLPPSFFQVNTMLKFHQNSSKSLIKISPKSAIPPSSPKIFFKFSSHRIK